MVMVDWQLMLVNTPYDFSMNAAGEWFIADSENNLSRVYLFIGLSWFKDRGPNFVILRYLTTLLWG